MAKTPSSGDASGQAGGAESHQATEAVLRQHIEAEVRQHIEEVIGSTVIAVLQLLPEHLTDPLCRAIETPGAKERLHGLAVLCSGLALNGVEGSEFRLLLTWIKHGIDTNSQVFAQISHYATLILAGGEPFRGKMSGDRYLS